MVGQFEVGATLEQAAAYAALPPGERRWPPPLALRIPLSRRRLHIDIAQAIAVATLAAVAIGSIAGIGWFWRHGVTWFDVVLLALTTWLVGVGITLGYHRLFTHMAFEARPGLRAALGILGAMGMQGPIKAWVSCHRKHHRYSDRPGDPHSPLAAGGLVRRFLHSHVGWMVTSGYTVYLDYIRDLLRDPVVAWVDRWYPLWVVLGWVGPGLIGWAWYGGWDGYWAGLFAGGPLRALLQLNLTWSVNSFAHLIGRRPFATPEGSRNSTLVNIATIVGEGLHNNHHAFPWSARFSLFPGEVDTSFWILRGFARLGWARNLRIPSPQLVARRAAASAGQPARAT
jgi:stearoyl-CoA desaturase (delta-9 desaturase)